MRASLFVSTKAVLVRKSRRTFEAHKPKALTSTDIEAVANSAMKKLTKQLGVEFRTV